MRRSTSGPLATLATVAGVALALGVGAPRASAQFRIPESEGFHNNTFVGDEPEEARISFFKVQESLDRGQYLEAGRELLRLLRSPVQGPVRFSERLVVPKERAVALKLAGLPPEVLTQLRDLAQPDGLQPTWSSPGALLRDAHRYPLWRRGEEALLRLGGHHLVSGEFASAAACLEELVHWPSARPRTLATLAAGRLIQAQRWLGEEPGDGPLLKWPSGDIPIGGEQRSLDLLRAENRVTALAPDPDWPTFLGADSRWRVPQIRGQVPVPLGTFDVVPEFEQLPAEEAAHRERFVYQGAHRDLFLPPGLPVVAGDRLVTLEGDGVHVRSLSALGEAFQPIRYDFDLHVDPQRFDVKVDRSSAAIYGNLLLVTLELVDVNEPDAGTSTHGALYGIDLAREGFIQFGVHTWDRPAEDPLNRVVFAGPALSLQGRVLVSGSRLKVDETECELFSFDSRTGILKERLFLARAGTVARFSDRFSVQERRRVDPSPLAHRSGVVYLCTNLGVVAAVKSRPLELQWLFRYNRRRPSDSRLYQEAVFFETGGWPNRAPQVLPDRLLCSPSDSRYLYSLARWPNVRGDLVLNDPVAKEDRTAWLGATETELLFLVRSGARQFVLATDHSGGILWPGLPFPSGEQVVGMPAQTRRYLFVPLDRSVYRLDLTREGFPDLVVPPPSAVGIPYPEYGVFGDLVVTENLLISRSSKFLHVFSLGTDPKGR